MKSTFMANEFHHVSVELDAQTGKCHVAVRDERVEPVFRGTLDLNTYNDVVAFVRQNDHIYVINMLNQRYG